MTVYVVQELKRYHCPKCDGTYAKREGDGFRCRSCQHLYKRGEGVAKPMHSLTESSAYGPIEVLYQGNNPGILMAPVIAQMKTKLKDFNDEDFLLPAGDPVLIGIAASIASNNNRGNVNFLRWDRETRTYIKITASLR